MTNLPPPTFPLAGPAPGLLSWEQISRDFDRRDILRSIPTALLCWFLTIIFSVSLAALIFR